MTELRIDGSQGEGGGQIVRTALSLSALRGQPVRVERVRGRRKRPGLLRQHLTALRAVSEICNAEVSGATLGSSEFAFSPNAPRAGRYRFAVETAGSACLVFQTVLWPLLFADGPSSVTFEGGTHNPLSPPYDFIERTFLPLLRRMGATLSARLERHGFYPAGGGCFTVEIEPTQQLEPIELLDVGQVRRREARAVVSKLPRSIAMRELEQVRKTLGWSEAECRIEVVDEPRGPGNVVMLHLQHDEVTETFTGFGQRGVSAERVAQRVADEVKRHLEAGVPVSEHLADQLIVPMVLAGGGCFRTTAPSPHLQTNIEVVARLLDKRVTIERDSQRSWLVR